MTENSDLIRTALERHGLHAARAIDAKKTPAERLVSLAALARTPSKDLGARFQTKQAKPKPGSAMMLGDKEDCEDCEEDWPTWMKGTKEPDFNINNESVASLFVSPRQLLLAESVPFPLLEKAERKPVPAIERRCVVDVMKKQGVDMSRAFAICRSSMQKASNYKPGTADLTKKGAAKSAGKTRAKDDPAKHRFFKREVKAARKQEEDVFGLGVPGSRGAFKTRPPEVKTPEQTLADAKKASGQAHSATYAASLAGHGSGADSESQVAHSVLHKKARVAHSAASTAWGQVHDTSPNLAVGGKTPAQLRDEHGNSAMHHADALVRKSKAAEAPQQNPRQETPGSGMEDPRTWFADKMPALAHKLGQQAAGKAQRGV